MCGIVGYAGNIETACGKPLEVCLQGLERLEYRGYDSAGVALTAPGMDKVVVRKKAGRLKNLVEDIERKPMPLATVGIGHIGGGFNFAMLINALKGISDHLIRMHSMELQQGFAAKSVASAQRTYDIATKAYRGGLTDYLNVLNAQTRLFQQQLVEQQVRAARLATHAGLVVALGGGLMDKQEGPREQKMVPETVDVRAAQGAGR